MRTRRNLLQICLLGAVLQPLLCEAQPVTKIAAGGHSSLFLKSDGSLWAMGENWYGELGDGTSGVYIQTNHPEMIVASNVTAISEGYIHSLFLKNDGSLWAMGDNADGGLGNGTYVGVTRPQKIVNSNVVAIAAGDQYSLFLKSDGSLWAMGNNFSGQVGDGTYGTYPNYGTNRPEQIVASDVTAIAAGYGHSLFLKSDGSLWGMGHNGQGELGVGTNGSSGLFGSLTKTNRPDEILASNVTAIAVGEMHSLFLKSDGSLWAMGYNQDGQLGDGTFGIAPPYSTNLPEQIVASNVTAIAAGSRHSMFLKNDGSLWVMGLNGNGQLGDGTTNNANRPEQIVANNVTAISAGVYHSQFLKSDGSVWAMGYNAFGQLGDGTTNSIMRPEQIIAPYNQISSRFLSDGSMQLSFEGIASATYALDCSSSLSPANWISQATNHANSFGALAFTNTPNPATNNFWRIRSVP